MASATSWSAVSSAIRLVNACLKGDTEGNLVYRTAARNFKPVMSTAARVTVARSSTLSNPVTSTRNHPHSGHLRQAQSCTARISRKPHRAAHGLGKRT